MEVLDSTISGMMDKILLIVRDWQKWPLKPIYAVIYLDAIYYQVRSKGHILRKVMCIAIEIDLDGRKEVLGMWVGENTSAKY